MEMRRTILTLNFLVMILAVSAQTLTVNCDSHVQVGENFRLTYTVNTQSVNDFRIGNIPDGLEIITGPYTSQQSSFQMVNGHTSSSSSITYTFILCANENGTYTIPPAHVNAGGHTISSQPVKVVVSGTSANTGPAPKMHSEEDNHQMRQAGSPITNNDLFIKVSANKTRVHEQEPILLTYKVFTLVDLTQLEGKMPDLTGFHSQEVKLPQQKSFKVENINGRNYKTVTWSQYVMYPQMTGKLEIPSITFNGTVIQQNRNVDPFEAFFNGGSGYVEVKRSIKAPGLTIQVDPLPAKPANFSGGVGKFNISAEVNKHEIRANDPLTVRVVVGGNGNLKLIKQPVVTFPKDFDTYDAKITDKTQLTARGVEGNMIYDFLAVPRNQGKYTIPAVEFTYYDTEANSYKTIKTKSFEIQVAKGDGNGSTTIDFTDDQNQDIRPIHMKKTDIRKNGNLFYGSTFYWILLALLLISFVALLIIFRRRAIENADIVKVRGKKANKVATRRLRTANSLMQQGKSNDFYDEVLRALWGYVGDKLNMPVTDLSHENISDRLSSQQVDDATIAIFIEALDECEFERYAPGDAVGNMNKTFTSAMSAIEKIEEAMKKKKRRPEKAHRSLLFTLIIGLSWFLTPSCLHAITKNNADTEYSKGNYQQAITDYEELLKKSESADLYYNLGNAYYRTDNITRAILSYERALLLNPADDDIRFNLQMARSKTIDKLSTKSELFFFSWWRSLVNLLNVDGWAWLAIISISIALLLVLLYLFSTIVILRKVGFFCGVFFFVLFLLSNIFAAQQKSALFNRNGAIVIAPSAIIKQTPSAGSSDQSVIHEGTRVDITDSTMKDWVGVRLADGRQGWLLVSQIERI